MKNVLEIVIVGQTKVKELEQRLHDRLGVSVSIKGKEVRKKNPSFADIGGKGTRAPFVIKSRSIQLKTIQNKFQETYGGCITLTFLNPEKNKEAGTSQTLKSLQNKYLDDKQREYVNTLKKSALFQLSLASHELFHSNFLYWLAKNHNEIFKKLARNWINWRGSGTIESIVEVKRENKNMDLVIEYRKSNADENSSSFLVLENKVKSIPNKEQLKKYSDQKNFAQKEDVQFVLLTFSAIQEPPPEGWQVQFYDSYIATLREYLPAFDDPYQKNLINDYCNFTEALFNLLTSVGSDNQYCLKPELVRLSSDLRINDLLSKHQSSCLAATIRCLLEETGSHIAFGQKAGQITIENKFLKGTPVCSIFYRFSEDIFAGIQLDGKDVRLAVRASENFAECLAKEFWTKDWWNVGEDADNFRFAQKRHAKRKNGSNFLEYKDRIRGNLQALFLYRHRHLTPQEQEYSVQQVASMMISYFNSMVKNQATIQRWIDENRP